MTSFQSKTDADWAWPADQLGPCGSMWPRAGKASCLCRNPSIVGVPIEVSVEMGPGPTKAFFCTRMKHTCAKTMPLFSRSASSTFFFAALCASRLVSSSGFSSGFQIPTQWSRSVINLEVFSKNRWFGEKRSSVWLAR